MYRQFFANMKSLELPLFALGLFVFAFALVVARNVFYRTKVDFDPMAALPLADEQPLTAETHEVIK
jgi:hypothetical protein